MSAFAFPVAVSVEIDERDNVPAISYAQSFYCLPNHPDFLPMWDEFGRHVKNSYDRYLKADETLQSE